jgi:type IV secretion system protein VirB6
LDASFAGAHLMATICSSITPEAPFLSSMLAYVDCQAQNIGENGYQALASPVSSLSPLLTLALTIFVALLGYRLLFGDAPRPREAVIAMVKVGIVLMLATSWPSFKTLVYDVTMRGPAELAQAISGPAGLPDTGDGLNDRLQSVDDSIAELMVRGTGQPFGAGVTYNQAPSAAQLIPFYPTRNGEMLAQARSIYLTSTIGAFASVRLLAGLLLALAPIFVLFLLFSTTRGLFEGWLRGLAGTVLGASAISIILAVEISLMEPWLAGVLSSRRADVTTPAIPVELFVATLVFALVLVAALFATIRLASGLRFPDAPGPVQWLENRIRSGEQRLSRSASQEVGSRDISRAKKIADAIAAAQRGETGGRRASTGTTGRAAVAPGTYEISGSRGRAGGRLQTRRSSKSALRRDYG